VVSCLESAIRGRGGAVEVGGELSSLWWRSLYRIREGVGTGVGRWFEENIRRIVGDGKEQPRLR